MRKILLILAAIVGFAVNVVPAGAANHSPSIDVEAGNDYIESLVGAPRPQVACTTNPVWVTYADPLVFPCDPTTQTVHVKFVPSWWTLSAAHTYCADLGSVGLYTRYAATANVCPDIDY